MRLHSNIAKEERQALLNLQRNENIIIKVADKGSAVVIMNKPYYQGKILEMLQDTETYSELDENMDRQVINKIKKLTEEYDNCLTDKEKDYLTKFDYKTSQFYGLPKIHKSKLIIEAIKEQNNECIQLLNPGDLKFRPIVAGPVNPTHRLSHLMDLLLQPLVKYVKSYIRDDLDFLNVLPENITESEILVIFDVVNLYSTITHELGMEALTYWLDNFQEWSKNRFVKQFFLNHA